ncbi:MAG: DNRLRE domain-containing protein [Promethearchaeota archaeon]
MVESEKKAKISRVLFIIIAISSPFLLVINFIPAFTGDGLRTSFLGTQYTINTTYVNQSNPDRNYYNNDGLYIGNFSEIYIHFNFNSLPTVSERLYFFLSGYHYDYDCEPYINDVEINIILTESSWNASEITWNNKPQHDDILYTGYASEIRQSFFIERYDIEKAVDLTAFLENPQYQEISLCINITNNNKYLKCPITLYGYKFLWYYEKIILSYITIITSIIIFSMLIGIIYFLRKSIFYCESCNNKRKLTDQFCSSCNLKADKDLVKMETDYLIIFILLWTFILIEGTFLIVMIFRDWMYFYFPFLIPLIIIPWIILCIIQIKKKYNIYKILRDRFKSRIPESL